MNTNRTEVVSMHTSERIYLLHILYDKYIYYSSSILASLVCIICIIKYSGIYSSGGQFGGFVTLAGVENFMFTLAGVDLQMFYSSGGRFGKFFTLSSRSACLARIMSQAVAAAP